MPAASCSFRAFCIVAAPYSLRTAQSPAGDEAGLSAAISTAWHSVSSDARRRVAVRRNHAPSTQSAPSWGPPACASSSGPSNGLCAPSETAPAPRWAGSPSTSGSMCPEMGSRRIERSGDPVSASSFSSSAHTSSVVLSDRAWTKTLSSAYRTWERTGKCTALDSLASRSRNALTRKLQLALEGCSDEFERGIRAHLDPKVRSVAFRGCGKTLQRY